MQKITNTALSVALAVASLSACTSATTTSSSQCEATPTETQILAPAETSVWVSLTVAEGKRLIAKGITEYAPVRNAMENAAVIITRGSTNHYILEEFFGTEIENGSFQTGKIIPKGKEAHKVYTIKKEYLYQKGKLTEIQDLEKALSALPKGSVVFKGGNILNHDAGVAAVLIGHPTGGTIGMIDKVLSDNIKLIVPIGLEKNSSVNMDFMAQNFSTKQDAAPAVHILNGTPFTEIEAIKSVADVEVFQYAAGGVDGAEGGVSLLIRGTAEQVAKATEFIDGVYGEAPFYSDNVKTSTW
ncbi:MAG: hypothetical protein SNG38_01540 [Rikenellaceae bacterium]